MSDEDFSFFNGRVFNVVFIHRDHVHSTTVAIHEMDNHDTLSSMWQEIVLARAARSIAEDIADTLTTVLAVRHSVLTTEIMNHIRTHSLTANITEVTL